MRDFRWFENEFWDASWHLFAGRPVLTYDIFIEFLLKKKKQKNKNKNKTKQAKANLMSTVEFRDVLDDSLFSYLEFDMNKYLKNWGNYDVLRIKLGKFIVTIFFYLWKLPCAAMFLSAFWNFAVLSILHMPYLSPFFSVLLSWNRYVCLVPPHLQGPAIVCAVFASPPFVGPACGPSLPQGGNDDTYF